MSATGRLRRYFHSHGEYRLALAVLALFLFGAGLGLITALRLGHGGIMREGLGLYDIWLVLSGGLGAAGALFLLRDRFGHEGTAGLMRALGGIAGVSFLAPLIAGTLSLPLYGTMFGPFTFAVILAGMPVFAVVWFFMLALTHLMLRSLRDERESIFRPLPRSTP
jgi:hypothetical protein